MATFCFSLSHFLSLLSYWADRSSVVCSHSTVACLLGVLVPFLHLIDGLPCNLWQFLAFWGSIWDLLSRFSGVYSLI